MKATQITTLHGQTIRISKEQGDKVRKAIDQKANFVLLDPNTAHVVRISTIAEVKDIYVPDTDKLAIGQGDPVDNRASTDSEAYKKFQQARENIFNKK